MAAAGAGAGAEEGAVRGVGPAAGTRRVRSLSPRPAGFGSPVSPARGSGAWAPQGPPVGAGRRRPLPRPSSQVRARYSVTARPRAPAAGDSEPSYLSAGRARPGPGTGGAGSKESSPRSLEPRGSWRGEAVGVERGVFVSRMPDPTPRATLGRFGETWWGGAVAGVAPWEAARFSLTFVSGTWDGAAQT